MSPLVLRTAQRPGDPNRLRDIKIVDDKNLSAVLDTSILSADLDFTIEGASTFTLKIMDEERGLLRSNIVRQRSTIELDGVSYTLVKVSRDSDVVSLIFEETLVNLLRRIDDPKKARRYDADGITRAQFIESMVKEANQKFKVQIPFRCPEIKERQPIAKPAQAPTGDGTTTPATPTLAQARARGVATWLP